MHGTVQLALHASAGPKLTAPAGYCVAEFHQFTPLVRSLLLVASSTWSSSYRLYHACTPVACACPYVLSLCVVSVCSVRTYSQSLQIQHIPAVFTEAEPIYDYMYV